MSNTTKALRGPRANVSAKTQQALKKHVERQRGALFQAQAIVQTVVAAMRPGDWPASAPGFPYALEAVDAMLERIAGELEVLFDLSDADQGAQS